MCSSLQTRNKSWLLNDSHSMLYQIGIRQPNHQYMGATWQLMIGSYFFNLCGVFELDWTCYLAERTIMCVCVCATHLRHWSKTQMSLNRKLTPNLQSYSSHSCKRRLITTFIHSHCDQSPTVRQGRPITQDCYRVLAIFVRTGRPI